VSGVESEVKNLNHTADRIRSGVAWIVEHRRSITARQFYKGLAMNALISGREFGDMSNEECVRWASEYADDMVAEDEK